VVELFTTRGIPDINDTEACVVLLEDERLYAEFKVKLTLFLETLDLVLPRPEGLPYKADAKTLAFIYGRARNRYRRGGPPIGKEVGHKVRKLIDDHVISLGIDPKIPPISIMDHDFGSHVGREPSNRAKASEMAHAIRHHIRIHLGEDPVYFKKLSERLEEILSTLENNWDALVEQLSRFVEEVQAGRQVDETGLDPMIQAPFMAIIKEEMAGEEELSREDLERLVDITVELVGHVRDEVGIVGFWRKTEARNALRGWIFQYLDQHDIVPFDKLDGVADRLMELAKANHLKLVEA
jgi:type I restriction enzyme R subunit